MGQLYPINLILKGKVALVVGGGSVAERKVRGLLPCEAQVVLVSPAVTETLAKLNSEQKIDWRKKRYDCFDMTGVDIVFASTNDDKVNQQVYRDAVGFRLPVNVADQPEYCTFFLPSVLRRGPLSIAVSTEGASPLLARRIRESMEACFEEAYGDYIELLASKRPIVLERINPDYRFAFWESAIEGRVRDLVNVGEIDTASAMLDNLIEEYANKSSEATDSPLP